MRNDPKRSTPHARNDEAMQQHFLKFLRSTQGIKPDRTPTRADPVDLNLTGNSFRSKGDSGIVLNLTTRTRSYLKQYDTQTAKVDAECTFQPSLTLTVDYNNRSMSAMSHNSNDTFYR